VIASRNSLPGGAQALPSWERLAAAVIDFIVLAVPEVILAVVIAGHQYSRLVSYAVAHSKESNLGSDPRFVQLAHQLSPELVRFAIVAAAITAVYLIGMYLGTGATLGKLALGLRISRVDGRPMTARDAVLRSLVFWVPTVIPLVGVWLWLLQYIGGTLVMLFRPDHRGPEDFLGGTIVVRKDSYGRSLAELSGFGPPATPPLQPPPPPPGRSGHLPGWGPVADQPPAPGGGSEGETS